MYHNERMRIKTTLNWQLKARENACDKVAIGFESDWLRLKL